MRTTPTRFTSAALFAAMACAMAGTAVAPPAWAQTSQGRAPSHAQKLEWPRTFSGQPDFVFTREEALSEARIRATRENESMPFSPSLQQLIEDDTPLDPLGLTTPKVAVALPTSATENASGTTLSVNTGQTLMERLMAEAVDLPAVASTTQPDLSEFSAQLTATISRTLAGWEPQAGRYNFESVLRGLVLQAIVTSPVKYAVINQQRYVEGETFRINVPMPVPDDVITAALQKQLPGQGTLPPAVYERYVKAYEDALASYATKRNQNPTLGQQTLVLPVRITAITPRQVMLDLNGQAYALAIRYAY